MPGLRSILFLLMSLRWVWSMGLSTHLEPGIVEQQLQVANVGGGVSAAFIHSCYAGTEVEIRLHCDDTSEYSYDVSYVLRSSPCDKEFYEVTADSEDSEQLLQFYFQKPLNEGGKKVVAIPVEAGYEQVYYYHSKMVHQNCKQGPVALEDPGARLLAYPVKAIRGRVRREAPNRTSENSLSSRQPTITVEVDAIYMLIVKIEVKAPAPTRVHNVSMEVSWRGRHGYLSAVDWPLLPFYGSMCGVYGIFALAWLIVSSMQWKDLLRIQFWIGAVIVLGMLEKAVFYAEYQTLNATGRSVHGAIEVAEIISCLKRTLARMLIIIVSVGFGVVKPRLGSTLHKVVGVGFVYFILSSIEAITRVSKTQTAGKKQKQLAGLPLTLLEVAIFWWIFTALLNTMRALRLRRNEVKLSLYRHFTNTLIFAVLASVIFMSWSLFMHVFTACLKDWSELWIDTAFWHILFSVILLVIMILWRPTNNNQRYAFTPLLDNADDDEDDDDDTLFSEAFTTAEAMKLRGVHSTTKPANRREKRDTSLEEELKWVEEHIPSSLADKALPALVDSDEEAQQAKFEISKMQ